MCRLSSAPIDSALDIGYGMNVKSVGLKPHRDDRVCWPLAARIRLDCMLSLLTNGA